MKYLIRHIPVGGEVADAPTPGSKPAVRLRAREVAKHMYPDCKVLGGKDSDAFVVFRKEEYVATVAVEMYEG